MGAARCLEEMYTVLPGTLYAQQDARTRDVRVDIDLHAGSILVAFQVESGCSINYVRAAHFPACLQHPQCDARL